MSKKLVYILAVFVAISSCSLVKQPFSFQKETGFHYDCTGLAPDCIHVEIKRGFALGEEEIRIETYQAYVMGNSIHWEGKTMDKNGEELPFVSFYEIDSTSNQNDGKFNESFDGFYLGNSDENGNFKIRSRKKSCLGFFIDEAGYLGMIYYVSYLCPENEKSNVIQEN